MAGRKGVTRIGVVIAMYREIPASFTWPMPWQIQSHRLGDKEIHLVVSGIGAWTARRAARRLCEEIRPEYLMTLGFCGAVHEGVEVGDLIVADRVADARQEIRLATAYIDTCLTRIEGKIRCHRGRLQSVKWHALSRRDVDGDALAVDMEAFAVADVATAYGIPAIIVKAISDRVPERSSARSVCRFMLTRASKYRIARATLEEFVKCYFRPDAGMTVSTGETMLSLLEQREESSCP